MQAEHDSVQELSTDDLNRMSKLQILEAARTKEATYRPHFHLIEEDHRRHLSREEVLNIYRLASRALDLRKSARQP